MLWNLSCVQQPEQDISDCLMALGVELSHRKQLQRQLFPLLSFERESTTIARVTQEPLHVTSLMQHTPEPSALPDVGSLEPQSVRHLA
jgi:hypothetical protein